MAFPTSFSTASAFWRFTTWSSWSDFGNTNCNIPVVWLSKLPRGLMFTILAWFFDDAIGSVMVMIMVINDDQSWWSWFTMTVLRGYIVWSWTTTCYPIPICSPSNNLATSWASSTNGGHTHPKHTSQRTWSPFVKIQGRGPTHWYKYSNNMQNHSANCPNWTSQSQPP